MNVDIDAILRQAREQEPTAAEIEQAASRVRARLFAREEAAPVAVSAIRSCSDFQRLIPPYLAGSLEAGRKLLLEVHTRECVNCRRELDRNRRGPDGRENGAEQVLVFPQRKTAANDYSRWAIAATVLIAAGGTAFWGYHEYPALGGGPRATVDSVDGALYRVRGDVTAALTPGAQLGEGELVRTAKNSTAVLRLNDGSAIEMNQRAELSVSRSWTGSVVHLGLGNIIVQAAKQRRGELRVATADCNVAVKGTIFSVNSGTKGSRVAVVEGTVWVDGAQKHSVLTRGQQTATSADMQAVPVQDEVAWSRNAAQYAALLGEFSTLGKQFQAIPSPGLRYESKLMKYLPANVAVVAAIPNVGGTLAEASRIFHDRLAQSDALNTWWNELDASKRASFETTISGIETASAYLGNEIIIGAAPGPNGKPSPLFLAELVRPGLRSFIESQLPPGVNAAEVLSHMHFDDGLFAATEDQAVFASITPAGAFLATPLYAKLSPVYQNGAGWVFAADLTQLPTGANARPDQTNETGLADARFLIAESRTIGGTTENRASLTFSHDRRGITSWLAAPGPMGSLEFVSPDAGLAAAFLLKNPSLIADDIMKFTAKTDLTLPADVAGAFGGEVAVAIDGPMLPVPSWKIAAEVYYPDRLQSSLTQMVSDFNKRGGHLKSGDLKLTSEQSEGRTFYRLQFEKLPWEADYTFVDGYWVAAANRELVVRSIQNRQTGYTLPRSNQFRSQLPHDGTANFSGVVFHNLDQTLSPLMDTLQGLNMTPGQKQSVAALKANDAPGVICFWGAPDRIDIASTGGIFGMKLESLAAMQAMGPFGFLQQGISHRQPAAARSVAR